MNPNCIEFEGTEDGVRLMAVFIAGLVKEGVVFKVHNRGHKYVVELTGGF